MCVENIFFVEMLHIFAISNYAYVSYKSLAILTVFRLFSPKVSQKARLLYCDLSIFAVLLLVISREKLGRNTKVCFLRDFFESTYVNVRSQLRV